MTTPPIFPALIGLGYSVIKRPIFYNASARSGSGWLVRVSYAAAPTWEWDLTFDVLRDPNATSDLRKLLGFYLARNGDLIPFLFLDPDDNSVTAQNVGTGDGTTTIFTLVRSYGALETGVENIGYLNTGATFNVYFDGTLQSTSTYDVLTATPGKQQISFHTAPPAAPSCPVITVDMSYYYYVHFKDPTNDFEKFADKFWTVKKITLESLRG